MKVFLAAIAIAASGAAIAAEISDNVTHPVTGEIIEFKNGYNLDRCLEYDRMRKRVEEVETRTCQGLRNHYKRQEEYQEAVRQQEERAAKLRAESEVRRLAEIEQKRLQTEQRIAARKQEEARLMAEQAVADAAAERRERAEQRKRDANVAALKARCGNDYRNPTIGMRIERVKECVAPIKLISQTNRVDGVVSEFRGSDLLFYVMNNRVIAWVKI